MAIITSPVMAGRITKEKNLILMVNFIIEPDSTKSKAASLNKGKSFKIQT